MFAELLKHPRALFFSLLFHAVIIGLMIFNLKFVDKPKNVLSGQVAKTVKAEVVDQQQLEDREKQKRLEEKRIKDAEKKKLEQKKKQEAEQKRKAEVKKKLN